MSGLLLLLFLLAVASLLFFTRLTVCTIAISRPHQNFWRWCFSCRLSWKFSAFLGWGAPVWIKKKNKKYYLPSVLAMPVLRSRPGSGFTHSHLESISSDGNEAVHVVQNLSDVFGWQNPLWLRHRLCRTEYVASTGMNQVFAHSKRENWPHFSLHSCINNKY